MKTRSLTAASLALGVALSAVVVADNPSVAQDDGADRVVLRSKPGTTLGRPTGVTASTAPDIVAKRFVSETSVLAPEASETVRVTSVSAGQRGGDVVRLQRTIDGIPVIAAETVVDVDARGRVRAVISENSGADDTNTGSPEVTAREAEEVAIAYVARGFSRLAIDRFVATAPSRWIYDPALLEATQTGPARQVWRTEVTHADDPGVRFLVLVDAATAAISLAIDQIADARIRLVCDAENSSNHVPCESPVRGEGSDPVAITDVEAAYNFAGDTYNFFDEKFGRDSLDDQGMPLVSTVRWCAATCPTENAFWTGEQMIYGAGWPAADDIVGHELTHGVTEFTSNLYYYYQSGAISESLSDIFGEFVDLTNNAGTDTDAVRWQLGEDLPESVGVLRDMSDPPTFGDPDRMGSPLYRSGLEGIFDHGAVHFNSGVGNKFAYLITDGDSFNGQDVAGLGIDKAARIIYGAGGLLTSGADYWTFAQALRQSCSNLVGTNGITSADCDEVDQAIAAVEMEENPANAPRALAQRCASGKVDDVKWQETFADENSADWARTGDLWFYDGEEVPLYGTYRAPNYSRGEPGNLWGADPSTVADSAIEMSAAVRVPADAKLSVTHAFQFDFFNGIAFDGGVIEYNTGGSWLDAGPLMAQNGYNATLDNTSGNPLGGREAFGYLSLGYGESILDLSSLVGQDVKFRFRIGTDVTEGQYGWFVDDLEMYQCVTVPEPTVSPTPTATATATPTPTPTATVTTQAPTRPTSVRVRDTRKKVTAKWAAVKGATSYRTTLRGKTAAGKQVKRKTVTRPKSVFKIRLKKGSRFKVCVKAVNGAGASAQSCKAGRR